MFENLLARFGSVETRMKEDALNFLKVFCIFFVLFCFISVVIRGGGCARIDAHLSVIL